MARVLSVKDQEQGEEWEWGVALVGGEWVEIALVRAPWGIVFAPVAEQRFLIKWAFPVTT